jgi:hypothetical protein
LRAKAAKKAKRRSREALKAEETAVQHPHAARTAPH